MEIDPKEYLNKTPEELEAIIGDIKFSNLKSIAADANKTAALAAYILKAKTGGQPSESTSFLDVLYKILSNDKLVETIHRLNEIDEFIEQQPDKEELLKQPWDMEYFSQLMKERTPSIKTKYPAEYIAPNDKITGLTFKGEITGEIMVAVSLERNKCKPVTTYAKLDTSVFNKLELPGLTQYDKAVYSAVGSHFEAGNQYLTADMIYQVLVGNRNAFINKNQDKLIDESIKKAMTALLTLNNEEEAKFFKCDTVKTTTQLLNCEIKTATLNGKSCTCYHILNRPILFEYANTRDQIRRVPTSLLNTPINKNPEVIILQDYLLSRIENMKHDKKLPSTIKYDTLYGLLQLTAASDASLKNKKAKVREQANRILKSWEDQKAIKGFTANKKGGEFYSITILLNK